MWNWIKNLFTREKVKRSLVLYEEESKINIHKPEHCPTAF